MAYLVRGKTLDNYYDVKYGRVKPDKFCQVYLGVDNSEAAVELARSVNQRCEKKLAIIDSVQYVGVVKAEHKQAIDWDKPWYKQRLVALDVETTGLSPIEERIAEIAFCEFDLSSRSFGEPESYLINDGVPMSEKASAINGITQDMLEGQPSFGELLGEFQERWVRPDTILIAHNRTFDMAFWLNSVARSTPDNIWSPACWCSMELSMRTPVGQRKHRLEIVSEVLGVEGSNTHRAGDDAQLSGNTFLALARRNKFFHNATTRQVMDFFDVSPLQESYAPVIF